AAGGRHSPASPKPVAFAPIGRRTARPQCQKIFRARLARAITLRSERKYDRSKQAEHGHLLGPAACRARPAALRLPTGGASQPGRVGALRAPGDLAAARSYLSARSG